MTGKQATTDYPIERVEGWGMSSETYAPVARPRSLKEIRKTLKAARQRGLTVGLRGAGCSYGDAALNTGGLCLDLGAFNRILDFDEKTGVLDAESGVTIKQVWRRALPHGWWPPVVPGTMFPTLGGCAGMNIHGKNNFQAGTIGEHILEFDLLLMNGDLMTCTREKNADVFHAAIGGFGMLGVMTRVKMRLKKVHSGDLWVTPVSAPNLAAMMEYMEEHQADSDYLVGWVDAFPGGEHLGRGLIHRAHYLQRGEDSDPPGSFAEAHQVLPSRFFGLVPKSWMWTGLWFFLNKPGMRLVNAMKYKSGERHARKARYRQPLVAFSFLLDYVPNWKKAYKPGGLIQYQSFVPRETALRTYQSLLTKAQRRGILPYLGVLKRHKVDPFLMTHAVDGYSLALDFPVRSGTREKVWELAAEMDDIVTTAGGRFYFAKDSTMTAATLRRSYPGDNVTEFLEMKRRLDPDLRLQTDLYRRIFHPLMEGAPAAPGARSGP